MGYYNSEERSGVARRLAGRKRTRNFLDLPTPGENEPAPEVPASYAGNTNKSAGGGGGVTAMRPPTDAADTGAGASLLPKSSWTEGKMPGMGKMNVGDFVNIAGRLGQAIAPNTAMGRVGGVSASMAAREQARVRAEPDKELKRKKTLAEIGALERPRKETALIENYNAAVKGGFKGSIEDWKKVGLKSSSGTTLMKNYEYAKKNGYKGSFEDWKKTGSKGAADGMTATQLSAFKEIEKMKLAGASLEDINNLAKQAGIAQYEITKTGEMVPVEGTGILGFFQKKEPETKITPVKEGATINPQKVEGLRTLKGQDGKTYYFNPQDSKMYTTAGEEVAVAGSPAAPTEPVVDAEQPEAGKKSTAQLVAERDAAVKAKTKETLQTDPNETGWESVVKGVKDLFDKLPKVGEGGVQRRQERDLKSFGGGRTPLGGEY